MTTSPTAPAVPYLTVIDALTLATHLDDPDWVIVDCRFDLFDPTAGERHYREGHIPGASYAHLERDLSTAVDPSGRGGRHPLPAPAEMARVFSRLGIDSDCQVIVYDDQSGLYAARLWWMLRYMGHDAVAVLDGGWPAWTSAGLPVAAGRRDAPQPRAFGGVPREGWLAGPDDIPVAPLVVDARMPERYHGEVEPLDPVPGRIPGAANRPYAANWDAGGRWRSQEALLADFLDLLGDTPPEQAVFYCGSGVTACVDLLALTHAGLPPARLYAGSYSEWSRLGRPIEQG